MRGTPSHGRRPIVRNGIIPAHAGNTRGLKEYVPIYRDHPRACGEHPEDSNITIEDLGSSPRMRGTQTDFMTIRDTFGIIPAHAGNTRKIFSSAGMRWDHPRACGEHACFVLSGDMFEGSSPRMRGTLPVVLYVPPAHGIIPAHAGNTHMIRLNLFQWWDHPRACGEHFPDGGNRYLETGSSPRMRGTRRAARRRLLDHGIIPAHAGNTPPALHYRAVHRDHPRACGEHSR